MYKYIILDGHNLLWQSLYVNIKEILVGEEVVYSGGIQQFINRAKRLIAKYGYEDVEVYFCFDNPQTELNIRKLIFDEYKSSRLNKKADKEIQKTFYLLLEILKSYKDNYRIVNLISTEADDLTKPLLEHLKPDRVNPALCISADLDWARNIEQNVHWYNYKEVFTIKSFEKKYGFKPNGNHLKMYKALKGDNSDSIPNATPHLDKKVLLDIVENYSTPEELYEVLWKLDYSKKSKVKLSEGEKQVRINYQLVDFVDINIDINEIIFTCKKNVKILKRYYKLLNLELEPFMMGNNEMQKKFLKKKKYK